MSNTAADSPCKGSGSLTRAQFLLYEMRAAAKLMNEGVTDQEIKKRVVSEKLFQYPTEKSLERMAGVCLHRLHGLNDDSLVSAIN